MYHSIVNPPQILSHHHQSHSHSGFPEKPLSCQLWLEISLKISIYFDPPCKDHKLTDTSEHLLWKCKSLIYIFSESLEKRITTFSNKICFLLSVRICSWILQTKNRRETEREEMEEGEEDGKEDTKGFFSWLLFNESLVKVHHFWDCISSNTLHPASYNDQLMFAFMEANIRFNFFF